MWSSNEVIKELHKIRERLYEDRKNMDTKEELKVINNSIYDVEKQYGIILKRTSSGRSSICSK